MRSNVTFNSTRLVIMLFVCAALPVLLMGGDFLQGSGVPSSLVSAGFGTVFLLLSFTPFYIIKRKTRLSFLDFAKRSPRPVFMLVSFLYLLYFAVTAASFLLRYSDMFLSAINADASSAFIIFLILLTSLYACAKGVNPLTRVCVFVFVLLIAALFFIFLGCLGSFDFSANVNFLSADFSNIRYDAADCLVFGFVPIIFGFTSVYASHTKVGICAGAVVLVFFTLLLSVFFVDFVLGDYSFMQPYSMHLLSKAAGFGDMNGLDGLYLAAVTACIFVFVSALLVCAGGCRPQKTFFPSRLFSTLFALIIFVLCCCANSCNSVKELLLDSVFTALLDFVFALAIPSLYLFVYRRNFYD